jgi:hypothetical protein
MDMGRSAGGVFLVVGPLRDSDPKALQLQELPLPFHPTKYQMQHAR